MRRPGPFRQRIRRSSQVEGPADFWYDRDETATLDELLDLFVPVLKSRPDCSSYLVDVALLRHDEPESSEVAHASKTSTISGVQRITVVGKQGSGENGSIGLHKSFYRLEIGQGVWRQYQVVFQDDAGLGRSGSGRTWQKQVVEHTTVVLRHV